MSDQSQNDQKPTLTLEEELDVLEAVYRVGKEKGLGLLRPEQVKKLMESGRINEKRAGEDDVKTSKNSHENVRAVIRNMISSLLSQYPEITNNSEWESFDKEKKEQVVRTLFGIHFGLSIEELSERAFSLLSGKEPSYG